MYENYSVLFVDDEVNILNSLRRGLAEEGYTSYFAKSGKEAIEIMEQHKVQVIVTDMRMPEMTGLELLKKVSERWPKTVSIILSGYTQLQQILTTINQVDIFKFITKPWNLEAFTEVIQKALDYYILREENENYRDLLENKNAAYKNMLAKVEDHIAEAKHSTKYISVCGKSIITFGKNFSPNERVKYSAIFNIQDEVYDILTNSVTIKKKEMDSLEFAEHFKKIISQDFSGCRVESRLSEHFNLTVNMKMLEDAVLTIRTVLKDELRGSKLVNLDVAGNGKVGLSMIISDVIFINDPGESVDKSLQAIKLSFLTKVLEPLADMCGIKFYVQIKQGRIIISFII